LGACKATGNYLLFMTQDALPSSDQWLNEMFGGLLKYGAIAVSCADRPRMDADLFSRIAIRHHNRFLGIDGNDNVFSKPKTENYESLRKNGNISDTACLMPKNVFMKYKFKTSYGEDLDLGMRLVKDGYKLAMLGSTTVIHSHNRHAYYHLKRGYIEGIFLSKVFPDYSTEHIRANQLLNDIASTYNILNSLINKALLHITTPCKVKTLINTIETKLKIKKRIICPTAIDPFGDKYIDDKFKRLLGIVASSISRQESYSSDANKIFFAMKNSIDMICEYAGDTYEFVDAPILEDLKSCIIKMFAFQAGTYLAISYLNSAGAERKKLSPLHKQLSDVRTLWEAK